MKIRSAWTWIGLGAAAAGVHFALGRDSALAEKYYSRGLFVGWRWLWDRSLGFSPVPWLYVFAVILLCAAAFKLFRRRSHPRLKTPASFVRKLGRFILRLAAWAGWLVFFFYALWGINYNRVGLEKQMGLEIPAPDAAALAAETAWASRMAAESRSAVPGITEAVLDRSALPRSLESDVRDALASVLREAGYPTPGRVRVRSFVPGGWMMRFSSTGIYIPYFGEGYAAGNLLPFERPFTMAHEMAHGYGITDEGAANFLAFLACSASSVPVVKYSGYAAYWGYAAAELPRAEFKSNWDGLPEGMRADIRASRDEAARYRGAIERVSQKIYARYLRSQGIDDGLRSYSRFVGLVRAWKKKTAR